MLTPIIRIVEVPCNQEQAFTIFIAEMDSWWPLSKFTVSAMGGQPAKGVRVDTKPGGEIVEIGSNGSEHSWGFIKDYDPYSYLSMHFHIPTPDEIVNDRSLVELTFTVIDEDNTRVELKQSNWEAFGGRAKDLQGGYGGGWTMIFEQAYKAACVGKP